MAEITAPNGNDILTTVHLTAVPDEKTGEELASKVHKAAVDRIAFAHVIAIDLGQITETDFSPVDPAPNTLNAGTGRLTSTGFPPQLVHGFSADRVKNELEEVAPAGLRHFGLFRSALRSESPVEAFMHLYHILLMFFGDSQRRLDDFIRIEEPGVPETPHRGVNETVYSRLRNEFGHSRQDVDLEATKSEMKARLASLIKLTKRAIELYS